MHRPPQLYCFPHRSQLYRSRRCAGPLSPPANSLRSIPTWHLTNTSRVPASNIFTKPTHNPADTFPTGFVSALLRNDRIIQIRPPVSEELPRVVDLADLVHF